MKQIMEALGKAVQALLSAKTLWFLIIVTAGVSVFLLVYVNNGLPRWPLCGMGCNLPRRDVLGLCVWRQSYQQWVGLTAVITSWFLLIGLLFRLWAALQPPQAEGSAEAAKPTGAGKKANAQQQPISSTIPKQA